MYIIIDDMFSIIFTIELSNISKHTHINIYIYSTYIRYCISLCDNAHTL